ncbi:CopD family protein [Streptomyces chiangmaiensis]|uniref:CopD family protein n=1 Tax=Streptomyces chiangmaiensis TaxID=766497 RepID=A0ABU7FSS5_9ACTN|nr:CopD family protein [Streptomyces chiangmaiensis]MED7827156.1 CopD family protein [Streptomyces chiangmaiensis]
MGAAPVPIAVAPSLRGPSARRAVAVLALVTAAALIPSLGTSAALNGTGEAAAPGVGGIGLMRAVLFAALCIPAGELFVARLARRIPGAPLADLPRSRAACAAGAGFVAALGLASVVATGNLVPHRLAEIDLGGLYRSRDGALALLEANAFLVAGLCALARRPSRQVWPLAAVFVAEALRAHPATEHAPLIGSGLTLVHLVCACLWAGGLLHALRTLRHWHTSPEAGSALLGLYARGAAVLLALITATGLWSSLRRMPPHTILDQLTTTAYGRALLAKLLLVAVVAVLAVAARMRLRRAADPLGACAPARAEVVVLGLVVAVSGLLTALPTPIRWS